MSQIMPEPARAATVYRLIRKEIGYVPTNSSCIGPCRYAGGGLGRRACRISTRFMERFDRRARGRGSGGLSGLLRPVLQTVLPAALAPRLCGAAGGLSGAGVQALCVRSCVLRRIPPLVTRVSKSPKIAGLRAGDFFSSSVRVAAESASVGRARQ